MKLLTYNDMTIVLVNWTPDPGHILRLACDQTMMRKVIAEDYPDVKKLIEFFITAGHTSVFEHVVYTFHLKNVSRSFLAQITRHRMGSFTSTSQHYQDYRDYPMVVHPLYKPVFEEIMWVNTGDYDGSNEETTRSSLEAVIYDYTALVDYADVPPEETKQILPNAAAVNLIWTVNARSLINFFEQKCCNRNTAEMQLFANKLYKMFEGIWPKFIRCCGPLCKTSGKCNQKSMMCAERKWNDHDRISQG